MRQTWPESELDLQIPFSELINVTLTYTKNHFAWDQNIKRDEESKGGNSIFGM